MAIRSIKRFVSPGQRVPRIWGTHHNIPSVQFVYSELAMTTEFEAEVGGVASVELLRPVRVQRGRVGPQLELNGLKRPGGGLNPVLEYDPADPFVRFVGPWRPIK